MSILTNHWLGQAKEKWLIKVVEWAQKQGIKIENLSKKQILEAIKSQR